MNFLSPSNSSSKMPSSFREKKKGGKKPLTNCLSTASTSASVNNFSLPLSGFVILVTSDDASNTVLYGTPADRAGLLIGDEIIEVNGIPIEGKEHSEIVCVTFFQLCCSRSKVTLLEFFLLISKDIWPTLVNRDLTKLY
ncbi:unnamed protein product [Enterobius vermicularis]|uniref:PDZ domain-containing protein n=1 Tax=Enterobius vermicularis TaxID=51028 RepID=A0A0N4VK51_ENTVE|nr:unnamed protein product [Enterobius vermicularis]